ncbi:MAG: winged helix-turn-helix domain-containing protein [Gammaproteobacteria bacterium]|nr:winged helix-turn-helix domain-containing protein [Gammaproteobacteria bacterium]
MTYRFQDFELDQDCRELRLRGREVALQPRVFDLLAYLIRHRERTVSKDELLDALWPGVIVTEASLQRAVSLARTALRQGGAADRIRTYARRGYRFLADDADHADDREPERADGTLGAARRASAAEAWADAFARYGEADAVEALGGADLERYAEAALCLGRPTDAIGPLERALAAYGSIDDRRGVARAAMQLVHIKLEQGEPAVARGWYQRAARALDALPESREHGMLAWCACRLSAAAGDIDAAVNHAETAQQIGERLGDVDVATIGMCYRGFATVAGGMVGEGLSYQDEAATAVLSGEVSPVIAGYVYCSVLWTCRNLADWSRASQWTSEFTRWCSERAMPGLTAQCRMHRAELLVVRGALTEAEREIEALFDELRACSPWSEGELHRMLGDIRLARRNLDGAAAAYRRAAELGWNPQPGLALEAEGWKDRQRRGQLLANLAIVASRAGELERARAALRELDEHASDWMTPAVAAQVAHARGEVAFADGSSTQAVRHLREALSKWQRLGSPHNVAALHLAIATVYEHDGDDESAELERAAAASRLRQLDASTATHA